MDCSPLLCLWFSAYYIWRAERKKRMKTKRLMGDKVSALRKQIDISNALRLQVETSNASLTRAAHEKQAQVDALTLDLEAAKQDLQIEKTKNQRPRITGEIIEVHDKWALPQVKAEGEQPDSALEQFFTIKARIHNERSTPTALRFELWVYAPHASCKAIKSSLSGLFHRYDEHATGTLSRMSRMQLVTDAMPDLEMQCRIPLAEGDEREGWLRFVLPKASNPIRREIHTVKLIAKDVYGGKHPIESPRSEWTQTGEIITQFVIDLEEQKLRDLRGSNLL